MFIKLSKFAIANLGNFFVTLAENKCVHVENNQYILK